MNNRKNPRCKVAHTKWQPDDYEKLCCPKCGNDGSKAHGFIITLDTVYSERQEEAMECELIHVDDIVSCDECDYVSLGKSYAARLAKESNQFRCPHCKGKGYVKGEKK